MTYLLNVHKHARDEFVTFKEEGHVYSVNGWENVQITSVTKFVKSFFPEFDANTVIENMMNGKRWSKSKYYGMTPDEIKKQWNDLGAKASEKGTRMHLCYETYYNQNPLPRLPENTIDLRVHHHFTDFVSKHKHWKPYRTEWVVYTDSKYGICGSVDMLFYDEKFKHPDDGHLYLTMVDWKRSKKISDYSFLREYGTDPLQKIPSTNYFHYSLQLNVYRHIIHTYYQCPTYYNGVWYPKGIKILFLYILVTHPDRPTYIKLMLPDYSDLVSKMFAKKLCVHKKKKDF
jgi:hypothetical protein